jgi:hypothetical protein
MNRNASGQCNGLISEPHKPRYLRPPLVLADFDDGNFTNASPRDLDYPLRGFPSVEHFDSGVLAEATIGGNRFAQIEIPAQNFMTENRDIEAAAWTKIGATITPNTVLAPDNTLTADKIIEDTSFGNHSVYNTFSADGINYYVASAFVMADEVEDVLIDFNNPAFSVNSWALFNISNGTGSVTATGSGILTAGIEYCGNGCGWYRVWAVSLSVVATTAAITYLLYREPVPYWGDGSSGLYLWNPQVEYGDWPSSPIHTEASPLTRAADQLYWPSASVPDLLRGRIKFDWIPQYDNTVSSNKSLMEFAAAGASLRIGCFYGAGVDKISVLQYSGSVTLVASSAITFNRNQRIIVMLNPSEGSIEIQGANSGNGKVVGTPWATTEGNVHVGQNVSSANQCNALVSEPYL